MNHNIITTGSMIQNRDNQTMQSNVVATANTKKHRSERQQLVNNLLSSNVFWSYKNVNEEKIDDDTLIAKTLQYLDLDDIAILFAMFSKKKIKHVWLQYLIPQGEYLYTLNKFLAWYYFGIRKPSQYVKAMETRYINKLMA